jgi:hypothetical protein
MAKKKFKSWEEQWEAEERERRTVEVEVDCDTQRLYGSIDEAIAYMNEIRDQYRGTNIGLDEKWTGYEDMHMRFAYTREENDAEYARRMEVLERDIARKAEERRKEEERKRIATEIKRLQSKMKRIV